MGSMEKQELKVTQEVIAMQLIVKDTKNFTPLQLAHTVAHSVVRFIDHVFHSDGLDEAFAQWCSGESRKVLRRARGASWDKLLSSGLGVLYESDSVSIYLIPPRSIKDTDKLVKKMQVSHLSTIPEHKSFYSDSGSMLTVFINRTLGMSPAKAAVAAGHIAQYAYCKMLEITELSGDLEEWKNRRFPMRVTEMGNVESNLPLSFVHVKDNGHTEVLPGSLTAIGVLGYNDLVPSEFLIERSNNA